VNLPERVLEDDDIWGFRESFDDLGFLQRIKSPRLGQEFDGRTLDAIVRGFCREFDVAQSFIWVKLIGETGFVTAINPPGKGYKAPLGFDCPDDGRDPRPMYYGVINNLRGGIAIWRKYADPDEWDLARRLLHGMPDINVSPEGQRAVRQTVTPRTRAEAAYLIYTPHLYSLHDFHVLLRRYVPDVPDLDGDEAATAEWARKARQRLMAAGITDGTNPRGNCTREMAWTMIDAALGQGQAQPVQAPIAGAEREG